MSDRAQISSSVVGQGTAGKIFIQADQAVSIRDSLERVNQRVVGTGILNTVESGGNGKAGSISIQTPSFSLTEGAQILGSLSGLGSAATINLNVDNSTVIDTGAVISSSVSAGGEGNGGEINIRTGSLSLLNGATLLTIIRRAGGGQPAGRGDSGNINIEARDQVIVSGVFSEEIPLRSVIASSIDMGATGKAGNISIQTGAFSLTNSGQIRAGLDLNASGQAGSIQIDAKTVSVDRGGTIITGTGGQGNSGNVWIRAQESVSFDGAAGSLTGVITDVSENAVGNGGNLNIQAGLLSVTNNAVLSTQTFSNGNAGNIAIEASQIRLQSGGRISTSTDSSGNAGNIAIRAFESVQVVEEAANSGIASSITTSTDGIGKAGDLDITTGRLLLRDGGFISTGTSAESQGQGGEITITASDAVEVIGTTQDSQFATTLGTVTEGSGNSGNLRINTKRLIVRDGGSISTETQVLAEQEI